jgi:Cof subfamily protein (haloacid dehalogenase superfamily)
MGCLFPFELLVPATTAQPEAFEDHRDDYDRHLRPSLVVDTLAALQAAGVEPDIWKVEGLDSPDDAAAVVGQARVGGRDSVDCIVLGRGASWDKVVGWLKVGAGPRVCWLCRRTNPVARRAGPTPRRPGIGGGDGARDRHALSGTDRRLRRGDTQGKCAVSTGGIRLFLADVDGTLVTQDKVLTDASIDAVGRLRDEGILFAITSGRPPRGMDMLVEPLGLDTPIAAFNGGLLVDRDMNVLQERVLPEHLVRPIAELIGSFGLDVWIYRGAEWYVPDPEGAHVDREAWTVKFQPKVMASLDGLTEGVAKIVGVSDDHDAVAKSTAATHDRYGDHVTAATSQPYYLDVTHPDANKGTVAKNLAERYGLSEDQIATIGDMPNDVLMFAHSGLSIAMGNADPQVRRAARRCTDTNDDDGFAKAVDRFVLPKAERSAAGRREDHKEDP